MMDDRLTEDESRVGLLEAREVPKVRGLAELVASRVCGEGDLIMEREISTRR
jgi:hypothetical protein